MRVRARREGVIFRVGSGSGVNLLRLRSGVVQSECGVVAEMLARATLFRPMRLVTCAPPHHLPGTDDREGDDQTRSQYLISTDLSCPWLCNSLPYRSLGNAHYLAHGTIYKRAVPHATDELTEARQIELLDIELDMQQTEVLGWNRAAKALERELCELGNFIFRKHSQGWMPAGPGLPCPPDELRDAIKARRHRTGEQELLIDVFRVYLADRKPPSRLLADALGCGLRTIERYRQEGERMLSETIAAEVRSVVREEIREEHDRQMQAILTLLGIDPVGEAEQALSDAA